MVLCVKNQTNMIQCLLLSWEISCTAFKGFLPRASNSFFLFLNRNLSGQADVWFRGNFPPTSEMTLGISSPAIYLCVSVCLCDSVETGFIRPHFSVPQKTVWSCLWNPAKNHKNPCVQAERSPVAKCLGNVCSKKSLFNDMTRNLDLTLRPIISGGKTSKCGHFQCIVGFFLHKLSRSHVCDCFQNHPSFRQELIISKPKDFFRFSG